LLEEFFGCFYLPLAVIIAEILGRLHLVASFAENLQIRLVEFGSRNLGFKPEVSLRFTISSADVSPQDRPENRS